MNTIQIFLVNDHRALSDGIKAGLEQQPDLSVIGQATDGHAAINLLEKLEKQPDVLITDIEMKGMHGMTLLQNIKSRWPKTHVIMLSQHDKFLDEALKLGASGYILKESGLEEIIIGIRTVMADQIYIDPFLAIGLQAHKQDLTQMAEFTTRELQIICLIVDERTTREIAEKLNIPFTAVETYARNIRRKTNATNIAGIVKYAIKHNLCEKP